MTSWRCLFLCVFLCRVDLSKEGCNEYFGMDKWKENLTDTVSLLITKDPKDIMPCTVENECIERGAFCNLLYHCLGRTQKVTTLSANCRERSVREVSYYHFICLAAKASSQTAETIGHIGCEYDTPCQIYTEKTITALDQTTLPPPPTTTATTTILPERTTATPTAEMPRKATTLPPPTAVTQSAFSHDFQSHDLKTETLILKVALLMSMILNVAVPLAVYMYMRRQKTRDRSRRENSTFHMQVNDTLLGPQLVTESHNCHCVVTHAVDDTGQGERDAGGGRLDDGPDSRCGGM